MQVNRVQNTQNFGMALRIKPEAVDALKKMTRSEVEELQKAGEALKDTKFYHLEIGQDGKRTVVSPFANKYRGGSFVLQEPSDEFLKFKAIWAGSESGNLKVGDPYKSCIKFENTEAAKAAYQDLVASSAYGPERDVKMVKYLDARAIAKEQEELAIARENEAVGNMVDNLFEKYGSNI